MMALIGNSLMCHEHQRVARHCVSLTVRNNVGYVGNDILELMIART
jgi:hypothetical protein